MDQNRSAVRALLPGALAGGVTAVLVLLAGVVYVVRAGGLPGGPTTDGLWFSGVMTGAQQANLEFVFFQESSAGPEDTARALCSIGTRQPVVPNAAGAFQAELLGLRACQARGLFDGRDVYYHIRVDGKPVTTQALAVHPVPYALYAEQAGTPDCPVGYRHEKEASAGQTFEVCRRANDKGQVVDELVKVGSGRSAFWIDRYEASIWKSADGTGAQHGQDADDYTAAFPDTGQWTSRLYALSRPGVTPSRHMTWFQAMEACGASGKRLPDRQAWLLSASGTPDPGPSAGADGSCVTNATGPRETAQFGKDTKCQSRWGAQDLVGSLAEWTDEWQAWVGQVGVPLYYQEKNWPYEGDGTWNIMSQVGPGPTSGLPAAALRGGSWANGARAGVFALDLSAGPGYSKENVGFRCMIQGS